MDDLLIRVITALVRVHDDLGPDAFESAARKSLLGIAQLRVEVVLAAQPARSCSADVIQLYPRPVVQSRGEDGIDEPA